MLADLRAHELPDPLRLRRERAGSGAIAEFAHVVSPGRIQISVQRTPPGAFRNSVSLARSSQLLLHRSQHCAASSRVCTAQLSSLHVAADVPRKAPRAP